MKGENEDELWDIYDANRVLTGKKHRRGNPLQPGEYHLVVYVCLFNHKNQMLIQHRQPWKHGWPNMWDLSVGGSAVAGDSSQMAAQREVKEEIGVDLDLSNVKPHFTVYGETAILDIYMVTKDVELSELCLQEEEVREAKWVNHDEMMQMVEEGIMIPHYFLDKIFEIKNQYGTKLRAKDGIQIQKATMKNLKSWMNLAEVIQPLFPGLETQDAMNEYEKTVIRCIENGTAICAAEGARVLGILLYSKENCQLGCLAVHPEYRRHKLGTKMFQQMLADIGLDKDITVETYREGDANGDRARAFYKSCGFVEGELRESMGYPVQIFVRKAN